MNPFIILGESGEYLIIFINIAYSMNNNNNNKIKKKSNKQWSALMRRFGSVLHTRIEISIIIYYPYYIV